MRQQILLCTFFRFIILPAVQCVHQVIQGGGTLFPHGVQLGCGSILRFLQQVDLVAQLGELLAERRLGSIAVNFCHSGARRNTFSIGCQIPERPTTCHIVLVEQQHALGIHCIRDRRQHSRFISIWWEENVHRLVPDIQPCQQQKYNGNPGQNGQRTGGAARCFRRIAHNAHPFAKKSWVRRTACSVTSGAAASSQTTPSI